MTFAGLLGQGYLVKRGGGKEEGRERVKRVKLVPVSQYLLSIGDTYRDHSVTDKENLQSRSLTYRSTRTYVMVRSATQ